MTEISQKKLSDRAIELFRKNLPLCCSDYVGDSEIWLGTIPRDGVVTNALIIKLNCDREPPQKQGTIIQTLNIAHSVLGVKTIIIGMGHVIFEFFPKVELATDLIWKSNRYSSIPIAWRIANEKRNA
jgi:hypothetical protein